MSAAFARLSKRERILVSAMLGLLVGIVLVFTTVWASGRVSTLESNVRQELDDLRLIYASSSSYLAAERTAEGHRKRAEESARLNLTETVAELAQLVWLESVDRAGNPTGRRRISDFLDYAPPSEAGLARRTRTRDAPDDELAGYFRRDLDITIREDATMDAIYELMERIERHPSMLFITELRLERNRRDEHRAGRGKLIVSTYFYDEKRGE